MISLGCARVLLVTAVAGGALVGCAETRVPMASAPSVDEVAVFPTLPEAGPTTPTSAPGTVATLTTATTAPATSADAVPAAAVIEAGPKGLSAGAKGAAVTTLEARLADLRFNPGAADGTYDAKLAMAVMAFQKQQELPRTGRADPPTLARLAAAGLGTPMVSTGEATRVEIDLKRQIAQFWRDGRLSRVLPVSTGNGLRYCVPKDKGGGCDTAITPGGSFRADRKIQGLRVSPLGSLYDPVYIYGGIAIHGSPSVPATPASHGCIRVPMWESRWVHDTVAVGDPVYVVGGKVAPVPFGVTAPAETPDEVTVPTADAPTDPLVPRVPAAAAA